MNVLRLIATFSRANLPILDILLIRVAVKAKKTVETKAKGKHWNQSYSSVFKFYQYVFISLLRVNLN